MWPCGLENLVGKTVLKLQLSSDEQALKVTLADCVQYYETDADCCSHTWIADIVGVCNLLGQTVLKAERVDVPLGDDEQKYYGIKLTTTRGYVDLVYRNSSNGYYGGSLGESSATSVRGKTWLDVTDDISG